MDGSIPPLEFLKSLPPSPPLERETLENNTNLFHVLPS